jgi:hypothetical protein
VAEVDVRGGKIPRGIDLGANHRPHLLALSRDGRRLWAACAPQQAVVEVSTESTSGEPALKAWKTGQAGSYMFALTPDERKIYAANFDADRFRWLTAVAAQFTHSRLVGNRLASMFRRTAGRLGSATWKRTS